MDWREEYENLPEVKKYTELVKRFYDKPSIKRQIAVWLIILLLVTALPFLLWGLGKLIHYLT